MSAALLTREEGSGRASLGEPRGIRGALVDLEARTISLRVPTILLYY